MDPLRSGIVMITVQLFLVGVIAVVLWNYWKRPEEVGKTPALISLVAIPCLLFWMWQTFKLMTAP